MRGYVGVGLLLWVGGVGCGSCSGLVLWLWVGLVVSLLFCRGGRFMFGF